MPAGDRKLRYVQLAASLVGFVLVLIFAPRLQGPRVIWGVTFRTKTGAPGLTNLGLVLLVVVPVAAYVTVGLAGRFLRARRPTRRA